MRIYYDEQQKVLTVNVRAECDSCAATGLYVGACERDGAAVVCTTCKGAGFVDKMLKIKEFEGRKKREGVTRVYTHTAGYVIAAEDRNNIPFSQYGAAYDDWLNGAEPKPIECLVCPLEHTVQGMKNKSHPWHHLYVRKCSKGVALGGFIRECKLRPELKQCWAAVTSIAPVPDTEET